MCFAFQDLHFEFIQLRENNSTMCGFGGYTGHGSESMLRHMNTLLAHRGPDAQGIWMGNGIGLAHTRLAILGLSSSGNQPMHDQTSGIAVAFNGEIYNFRELRAELEGKGATFRTHTDTEVLLHGYRQWGIDIVHRLQGMFAFALWDDSAKELYLVRDRLGIKPLFYAPSDDGIVFASEIKAIFAHPRWSPQMNEVAVDQYLAFGYVPPPQTIFQGIYSVEPGYWLRVEQNVIHACQYWEPDFSESVFTNHEDELVEELDAQLNDAIRSHLVADVPVGILLSGGLDSSVVAAIAQRYSDDPLKTFTIGFEGGGDERGYARDVSRHIGSHHKEGIANPSLEAQLPRLVWHLDQPLFDNSALPTYLVSHMAQQEVKVVLSGDGGDEPFAGYDWTRRAVSLPSLTIPSLPYPWERTYQANMVGKCHRLYYDLSHTAQDRYVRRITADQGFRMWLYAPDYLTHLTGDPIDVLRQTLHDAPVRDAREAFLFSDMTGYLPDDVLCKVDRMSMACGLEVRVPLLDHRLIEWTSRLPWNMRFQQGRGKYLLRRVAARYLPAHLIRPRKQGFTIPIGQWLRGHLGTTVKELFATKAFASRGIVRPDRALQLLDMHQSGTYDLGHRIWSLVILETWCRVWLDGQTTTPGLQELVRETEVML